jgi:hypothetical protein
MRRSLRLAALLSVVALAACADLSSYEKKPLERRIMQFDANDLEIGYHNKVLFSREVSGGRPGHSAGGGCGCGN